MRWSEVRGSVSAWGGTVLSWSWAAAQDSDTETSGEGRILSWLYLLEWVSENSICVCKGMKVGENLSLTEFLSLTVW